MMGFGPKDGDLSSGSNLTTETQSLKYPENKLRNSTTLDSNCKYFPVLIFIDRSRLGLLEDYWKTFNEKQLKKVET